MCMYIYVYIYVFMHRTLCIPMTLSCYGCTPLADAVHTPQHPGVMHFIAINCKGYF